MGHVYISIKYKVPVVANCGCLGFSGGSVVKESTCQFARATGDVGSIPGLERFPEEGNGNPLQYCCLGNPMGRGVQWATVCGVARSGTEQ